MKRQRSSSVKESPKEASVSINKRHKTSTSEECPITVTTRKHLASLPTHGELVVEQGVAQIPALASKSVSDIRQALASIRKQKKAGGSTDVSSGRHDAHAVDHHNVSTNTWEGAGSADRLSIARLEA